jgi:hypothetical protein
MGVLQALPQPLYKNCIRGQNHLLSNPHLLYALQSKRHKSLTSAATVRTSQTLVLQSTGERSEVVAVHSAKCRCMFPWQPQLLQLTAECLCIYTVTSRGCEHKQQCCHTCLNLTRLCNMIQVPSDSLCLITEPHIPPVPMGMILRQLHTLPINKTISLTSTLMLSYHFFFILRSACFQKHILTNCAIFPIWSAPYFQVIICDSRDASVPHYLMHNTKGTTRL